MPPLDSVEVGAALPTQQVTFAQADLIRYAGASGDFNPLHWDAAFAAEASPTGGVIAHGMLSMGHVARLVAQWAGGSARVRRVTATFRAACPVGATVTLGGEVVDVDAARRTVTLAVWAELPDGARVVDRRTSRAVVELG